MITRLAVGGCSLGWGEVVDLDLVADTNEVTDLVADTNEGDCGETSDKAVGAAVEDAEDLPEGDCLSPSPLLVANVTKIAITATSSPATLTITPVRVQWTALGFQREVISQS